MFTNDVRGGGVLGCAGEQREVTRNEEEELVPHPPLSRHDGGNYGGSFYLMLQHAPPPTQRLVKRFFLQMQLLTFGSAEAEPNDQLNVN